MIDQSPPQPAILIVDDDPATLRMVHYIVRKLAPAHPIVTAEDGQHAFAHLAARPIPLLITDYLLPDMDGVQLIAAVKAASPQTYVVLTSADDSPTLRQRAREHAVDLVLSKLDLTSKLGDVLRSVLAASEPAP
jgi:CheY-like chemotaxis protein